MKNVCPVCGIKYTHTTIQNGDYCSNLCRLLTEICTNSTHKSLTTVRAFFIIKRELKKHRKNYIINIFEESYREHDDREEENYLEPEEDNDYDDDDDYNNDDFDENNYDDDYIPD